MALFSCHEKVCNPNEALSKDAFSALSDPQYKLNSHKIRHYIDVLMRADTAHYATNHYVRRYYSQHHALIWVDRGGVLERADTLLYHLREAVLCGIDTIGLRTEQIGQDIQTLHMLDFNEKYEDINLIMARLEYNLTRAYFFYSAGQQFGFINPDKLLNNIEICDSDTVSGRITYSYLSDLRIKRPDSTFFSIALRKSFNDSIGSFMASIQPQGTLYKALLKQLNRTQTQASRLRTLCNIERCRWRQRKNKPFEEYDKYVIVNIPACILRAVNGKKSIEMRVGVGTIDHKTPMLSSFIKRMDINPQWIIPKSIAKDIVGRHNYMHSEGMFIIDKKKGKLPPEAASYTKVINSEQYIVQAGGFKNPLGRIIFRFDNDFAVYLHDTSSPWIFQRNRRDVSHGCVRVEHPLELAEFMLNGEEPEIAQKLRYSMTVPFVNDKDSINNVKLDKTLLVNTINVIPPIPIFIVYYTEFCGANNEIVAYDDLYGYDEVLSKKLLPFIK